MAQSVLPELMVRLAPLARRGRPAHKADSSTQTVVRQAWCIRGISQLTEAHPDGRDNSDSPRHGRAHFLGVWRLMSDLGASCGPALLSFLAGSLSLAAGIATNGLIAFAAAGVLARWIPRKHARE